MNVNRAGKGGKSASRAFAHLEYYSTFKNALEYPTREKKPVKMTIFRSDIERLSPTCTDISKEADMVEEFN